MMAARSVTVLGAGIGGLAAATALAQTGWQVTVLERAKAITEVGAGLQISPNGAAVLRGLGLEPALVDQSLRARAVRLHDGASGREVAHLPLNAAYHLCHRADLITLLADAAGAAGATLRLGSEIRQLTPGTPAEITLAEGRRETAPLVIAADGLHSVARQTIDPATPVFTGQVAWRTVIPDPQNLPPEAHVFMGPGRHLVRYPLQGGRLNLVGIEERKSWAAEGWTHADDPRNMASAFDGFSKDIKAVLDNVTDTNLWGLHRHPVATTWHKGNIALLGDAAHATLPFLAQGANMALEDAWCLARCLDRDPPDIALPRYQALRQPRCARIVDAANKNARRYHLGGPARPLAHLGLRTLSAVAPKLLTRQFDWLYGHDITKA